MEIRAPYSQHAASRQISGETMEEGYKFRCLTDSIDTRTQMRRFFVHVMETLFRAGYLNGTEGYPVGNQPVKKLQKKARRTWRAQK